MLKEINPEPFAGFKAKVEEKKEEIKEEVKPGEKAVKKKKKAKEKTGGKLLLVESPTKVNTIKKYVGSKFKVLATKGHVKDLPKSKLGVDTENNFVPTYIVMRDKKKILSEIKKEIKKSSEVFIGTDPDREGEAICWHIAEEAGKLGDRKIHRILFNEITKTAVLKAIATPQPINMNLVNAQQARRVLDRLVGYKISPLLWKAIRKGLSAGRVQSVALKIIVDRQNEIDDFNPVEYWSIEVMVENNEKKSFEAKLTEKNGEKVDLKVQNDTEQIVKDLKEAAYLVDDVQKKERTRKPLPPFITSTLQQDSARKYRFTAQKTMIIAQQLYEGLNIKEEGQTGLITYMRTDSLRVGAEAQTEVLEYIKREMGSNYAPEIPNFYKSKKSAQDAHEAIRPTSVLREPEKIKGDLDADQYKVYSLIWKRFVASQMVPSVFDDTRVKIKAGEYTLQSNGSVQKFDGFLRVYDIIPPEPVNGGKEDEQENNNKEESDRRLPELNNGDKLNLLELNPNQHFTQPPPAFSDAALIKVLEEKDIGRPSTYAPIISTLVYRKYVDREKSRFVPTELGTLIADVLQKNFSEIINEEFTARMEDDLDRVEEGTVEWHDLIRTFYTGFEKLLEKAAPHMEELKKDIQGETGLACEKCGGKMIIKWGRHGKFLSCEKYPECKNAKPLGVDQGGQPQDEMKIEEKCPDCGGDLLVKVGPFGKFIACSKYPECKYRKQLIVKVGVKCPDCGDGDVIERTFRKYRKFYGCSNYPKCNFMVWDKPILEPCPKCGAPFILEKWRKNSVTRYCRKCDHKVEVEKTEDA